MAFKKGDKKPEGSGIKLGQKIKRSEESLGIVNDCGMDPRVFMAHVMNWKLTEIGLSEEEIKEIDVRTQLEIRASMAKELAPYVAPKLKAVEHSIETKTEKSLEEFIAGLNGKEKA